LPAYEPIRQSRSEYLQVRGLRYHVRIWEPAAGRPAAGSLVMLHGWMDVSASFQFVVDSLQRNWRVLAPDWRGFGLTGRPQADCYWFPDYLADLDVLLDALGLEGAVDLVAHSMGGNVAMLYAGVRPQRVRRLVNLEGTGMAPTRPDQAPARYARWIDELRHGARFRDYASREEVLGRLRQNNPRLREDFARFLSLHWAHERADGRFELAGDPAHKIVNPYLYNVPEVLACWRNVSADVMMVFARQTDRWHGFVRTPEYQRRLLALRSLSTVALDDVGHMMHHDRPDEIARLVEEFFA
jgi:pimeloyl-ACP methyl ester carboxylesterase